MKYSVTLNCETKPNADNIAFSELREYTGEASDPGEAEQEAAKRAYGDERVHLAYGVAVEPA